MKEPIVELTNVCLRSERGAPVFQDMNLTVHPGRSAVISGPAGSGKTTLIDLLIGVRYCDTGAVAMFGEVMRPRRKRIIRRVRRQVGGVGGRFGLLPLLTVAENITLPLIIAGTRRRVRRERLRKALTEFSLLKQAGQYPSHLTRVENTMVQLARAQVANQPLIVIDEPLAGLDPKTYRRVLEYMIKVALSGRSMVIVTSEVPSRDIPETDYFDIVNGALA